MKQSRILMLLALLGVAAFVALFILTSGSRPPSIEGNPSPDSHNGTDAVVEMVGVSGSDAKFPISIESAIGSKKEKLVLTGTALRERFLTNVYTIGSYLQDGAKVTTAEELCHQDCSKQLHLMMERSITGKQMADALTVAVRKSHPSPEFDAEIAVLTQQLQTCDISKGGHIWITNVPSVGLRVDVVGKVEIKIASPDFAKAIWGVYLGKNNLGEPIKSGLVSRLK